MAKSRRPDASSNDGELDPTTRDTYSYPSRKRKALLGKLQELPGLQAGPSNTFFFQDPEGQTVGRLTVDSGELQVEASTVAWANEISEQLMEACESLLTLTGRVTKRELPEGDSPLEPGLPLSIEELFSDPSALAQLEAALPPGVDLSSLLEQLGGEDDEEDDEDDEDDELLFSSIHIRVDLLGGDDEHYWVLKLPDWLNLQELHEILCSLMGREPGREYSFGNPRVEYIQGKSPAPGSSNLQELFESFDVAFYMWEGDDQECSFMVRLFRTLEKVSPVVELLRGQPYLPGGYESVEDFEDAIVAGTAPQAPPAEISDRHFEPYIRVQASQVGPYRSEGLGLPTLLVAVLLERDGRTMTADEAVYRLGFTDYGREIARSEVVRAASSGPVSYDRASGDLTLDKEHPKFAGALKRLERQRVPDGPKLLTRRFTSRASRIDGQECDVVVVIDDEQGLVHGIQPCLASDGLDPDLHAIFEALQRVPHATTVVVDDPYLRQHLIPHLETPVEYRLGLEELWEPFESMETHLAGDSGFRYPETLSRDELTHFCAAAERFYLKAPWSRLDDDQLFEIEGLTSEPLIASITGAQHEVYGLGLFRSLEEYQQMEETQEPADTYCFMDFLDGLDSRSLREQLREEGVTLLHPDLCPYAYSGEGRGGADHFRLLAEVLDLVAARIDNLGEVDEGTTDAKDSLGRNVRVSFPAG